MTGPAVPAVPALAGQTGTIQVMPNTGQPGVSAVQQATDAARAAIAANGTALPAPAPIAQPRLGDGTFTSPTVRELPTGQPPVPGVPGAPAPATGPDALAAQPPAVPGAAAPVPGTPGDAALEPVPDAPDPLAVELPILLGDGEEPFMLQAADEATAEAIRAFAEEAVVGREATLRLDAAQAQLDELANIHQNIAHDPDGVAYDIVAENPQAAMRLALSLLTRPDVYRALAPTIAKLATPGEFAQTALAVQAERQNIDRTVQTRLSESRAVNQNLADIETALAAIVADAPANLRNRLFFDMRRDVGDYAARNRLLTLPLEQLHEVVAERLTDLGLDPEASAAKAAAALAKRGRTTPAGRPGITRGPTRVAPRVPAPTAQRTTPARPTHVPAAPKTGAAFVASAGRRATMAAIPTGGAGSPGGAQPLAVPRNADGSAMSTEQTIAWHRATYASGVRHY